MTGVDMSEDEKVEYFKKLHRNYLKSSNNVTPSGYSSRHTPNETQKILRTTKSDIGADVSQSERTGVPGHDRVYIHRDYIPMEYHYKYKPEKERGYGCQQCSIF